MPVFTAALTAALISVSVGAATAGFIASVIVGLATSLVLGALSKALFGKPKGRGRADIGFSARDRTLNVRQPITARRLVYGQVKVGGPILFLHSTGNNQTLHVIVALAGHEVAAIDAVYFNDELVPVNADGSVGGRYAGKAWVYKHLGSPTQAADAALIAAAPDKWTAAHKLSEIAYLYVQLTFSQDLFGATGLPNISAVVKGRKVFDPRSGATGWSDNPALCLSNYLTDAEYSLGVVYATEIDETALIAAANACDEYVALSTLNVAVSADPASDAMTLGDASARLTTGARLRFLTTGTLPGGLAPGVDYYWMALTPAAGKVAVSLANARAGTAIDLTGAGTGTHTAVRQAELRFTANGIVETDQTPKEAIQELLTAIGGLLTFTGGRWAIFPAVYRVPTVTLTETDARAPLRIQTRISRRENFNAVKGVFVDPASAWQPTDFPAVTNATYLSEDGGERVWKDINLPFTIGAGAAQRLAKIEMERTRQSITVTMPCKLTAFRVAVADVVNVTNARLGWAGKPFEVRSWAFAPHEDEQGNPALGVDLTLRETASAVFDWAAGEETKLDPAPNTTLPDPFAVPMPANLALASGTAQLLLAAGGVVVSRIEARWTPPADGFVAHTEVEWRDVSAGEAYGQAAIVAHPLERILLSPVVDGHVYAARARAVNFLGVKSPYAEVANHIAVGKTEPPPNVDQFAILVMADGTRRFSWLASTIPPDVAVGGGFAIRYKAGLGHAWEAMAPLFPVGLLTASPVETNELAAGTYTFAIKMVDSTGHESAAAAIVEAAIGDPRLRDVLLARSEADLKFPGSKTDCFRNPEGHLEAMGNATTGTWAALPATWSALNGSWLGIVPSRSPIVYETPTIDLGADISFTPLASFDGLGAATIAMQVGTSAQEGPVGAFVALARTKARFLRVRATVAGATPLIRNLAVLLDGQTVIQDFDNVNTAAASAGAVERLATGHFKIATDGRMATIVSAKVVAFQNAGAGWTWELLSKATTITGGGTPAAEFKIYQNGVLADATVDVEMKGVK